MTRRGYGGNNNNSTAGGGNGGADGNGGGWQGESAAQWEAQWRADVARQLGASGKALQDTALTLERLGNRLDEHDRRIGALEGRPERMRANASAYGGLTFQLVFAFLSLLSILITLSQLIGQHWH